MIMALMRNRDVSIDNQARKLHILFISLNITTEVFSKFVMNDALQQNLISNVRM